MKRIISILLSVCFLASTFVFVSEKTSIVADAAYNINGGSAYSATFIIDPGHGGSDPGACALGRSESADVTSLALAVGRYIISAGETVNFTRVSDITQTLAQKVSMQKGGSYSYFVSIHRNAGGGTGVETFYYSGSTPSYNLAKNINDRLASAGGWANRGLKTNSLYVVSNTTIPACLTEVGFIDTAADNATFVNRFEDLALAIANGMLAMVGKSAQPQGGWQLINNNWYYVNADGSYATGWISYKGDWYYCRSNGVMATGWELVNGKWYFFDADGVMQTGWLDDGGVWYYLDSSGAMLTGWNEINGSWYYFNTSGAMQTGWLDEGGNRYYLDSSGAMLIGWNEIDGNWYYFNASGAMQTGWLDEGGNRYYLHSNGAMATGWTSIDGSKYYFNKDTTDSITNGSMQTGFITVDGAKYYLAADGKMQTGFVTVGGAKYYFGTDGKMQTGFVTVDGAKYYLGTDGKLQTGFVTVGGVKYYLGADGKLHTGWFTVNNSEYYADENGAIKEGWQDIDGSSYYIGADGKSTSCFVTVDGKTNYCDENGKKYYGNVTFDGVEYYCSESNTVFRKLNAHDTIDGEVSVYNADGQAVAPSAALSTGFTAVATAGDKVIVTYTVVVNGDVDCNGVISVTDYICMARNFKDAKPITELQSLASDFDNDGILSSSDLLNVANAIKK